MQDKMRTLHTRPTETLSPFINEYVHDTSRYSTTPPRQLEFLFAHQRAQIHTTHAHCLWIRSHR